VSRQALGPTQSPIQWVPGALSLEVKRPGREADHSPPSSVEVKECVELYLHSPNLFMAWYLVKHRDFTFTVLHLRHFQNVSFPTFIMNLTAFATTVLRDLATF
jgi:hypothetical protein